MTQTREARAEYLRQYNATPERIEKARQYNATPERIEKARQRNATPEVIEKRRQHAATPEAREKQRQYDATPERIERKRERCGKYPVEAKVEQYLVDSVITRGGTCPKFTDPGRRGAPDRIVCLPGHPSYFVELKRPKFGKLDAHQTRYHETLRIAGQRVWVIWSNEEVDGFFASI